MKKYTFLTIIIFFISCSTLGLSKRLKEKEINIIERDKYFLYFYPGSEIYIKKDKLNNQLSVFFNIFFNYKGKFNLNEIEILRDDKLIGSIKITKIVSILDFKFLYINIKKDNLNLILEALSESNRKITFKADLNCFQVWTKKTIVYDSRYIDVDFKSTIETLNYAIKNNIL